MAKHCWMAFLVSCALLFHSNASAVSDGNFYIPINRSEIVKSPIDLGEVIVADPEVADIYVHGKSSVSIIGRNLGQTTVRLFDDESRLVRELDIYVTYDLPAIRKALHEFLPYETIGVEMVNTRIALTGEVSSAEAAQSAVEIATQFVQARVNPNEETTDTDQDQLQERQNSIINLMRISAGQQVMLRIRIGEIRRGTLKQLGAGLQIARNTGNLPFQIFSPSGLSSVSGALKSISAAYTGSQEGSVSAVIDALTEDNLFKVLAEPNLVALSGEEAEFLAGGEVPIPVAQQNDTITVDYRAFGVSLRFTPYVLSANRIRIQVEPEVSQRNDTAGINVGNGLQLPSFDVRRASTTVELAPGESFMIAGLLQDTIDSRITGVPGVNQVPFLSSLFRTTDYAREETELILAVTPYLVDPIKASDVRLPTDDFRPATFMESVFYGAVGSLQGGVRQLSQTPTLEGPIGFMVD